MISTAPGQLAAQPRPNEIPPGWRQVKFGDVVRHVTDNVDPATSGLDRYVAGEHMETDNLHIRSWGTVGDGYLGPAFHRKFVRGQILYGSRRTYLRKVAVAEFDGICSNTTFVLEPNGAELLPELLPFIMQSEAFTEHSIKQSKGSVNPYINWKDIAWYEFLLPPKDEQRRIADILLAADDVAEYWRLVEQATIKVERAALEDLFSSSSGWPRFKLGELFEVQLGKMLSPASRKGISPQPYLGNSNVQWGRFDLTDVKYMDFDAEEFAKFRLRPGDILVCEGGEVGRTAIWQGEIESCCYQKAVHRLRPRSKLVSTEFMLLFMKHSAEHGIFAPLTGHSTIAHLTAVKLKTLEIPVPASDIQEHVVQLSTRLEMCEQHVDMTISAVRKLKGSLLSGSLGGSKVV